MKLSALIPSTDQVINLEHVTKLAKKAGADEIIVATRSEFRKSAKKLGVRVVPGGRMRGQDYNTAAHVARGDVLVLLHQNTVSIPRKLFSDIKAIMDDSAIIGGGVNIAFDNPHWLLNAVAFLSNNYRMRLRKVIYADQTLFMRKSVFLKLKGFKAMPIFEDTDFSARLRKQGKLVFLKGPVVTSAYRFVKNGVFFHTLRNQLLKLFYLLGIPPKVLKRIYEWRIS